MRTTTTEDSVIPQVQDLARQLLRRLMAERNMRTTGICQLLNVESHTVRRMLNGSRAISLDELVTIAQLGGYSLDAQFKLGGTATGAGAKRDSNCVNDSLGKVFAAIADLLSSAPAGAHNFETRNSLLSQRRAEPAPREMATHLSAQAHESLARIIAGEADKRKRGRPRKVA
jgi:hypothetical protein